MALDLRSCEAKFRRSKEHADAFRRESKLWMDGNPYGVSTKTNSDCTRHSLIAHLVGPDAPFEQWTLIVSDCLQNLRASLDHLLYAIAIHESSKDPPPKHDKIMFPICDLPDNFVTSNWRIEMLSLGVRTAIEGVQPYNRQYPTIPPPLTMLRELTNADKHRLLQLAYEGSRNGDLSFSGQKVGNLKSIFANQGEVEDGAEIAAFEFDVPNRDMKYDRINLEVAVVLWHGKKDPLGPEWSERSDCSALLTLITNEVRHVIDTVVKEVI